MAPAIEDRGQLEVVLTGVADGFFQAGSIRQTVRNGQMEAHTNKKCRLGPTVLSPALSRFREHKATT